MKLVTWSVRTLSGPWDNPLLTSHPLSPPSLCSSHSRQATLFMIEDSPHFHHQIYQHTYNSTRRVCLSGVNRPLVFRLNSDPWLLLWSLLLPHCAPATQAVLLSPTPKFMSASGLYTAFPLPGRLFPSNHNTDFEHSDLNSNIATQPFPWPLI